MNTLNAFILSTLCITTYVSHSSTQPSTHKEVLQYDLAQRKATQKFVKNVRNISATLVLAGIIGHLLGDHPACIVSSTTRCGFCPESFTNLFLKFPFALTGIYLKHSLLSLLASQAYSIYNDMHIETLQKELAKLEQTEFANI